MQSPKNCGYQLGGIIQTNNILPEGCTVNETHPEGI